MNKAAQLQSDSSVPGLTRADVRTELGELRRRAGLRQYDLAELVGLSQPYVTLLETNRRPMSDELADRMIVVLGIAIGAREESRRKIKELVSDLFPWTEEDERSLQRERARRERALKCE
jgi:transcriptional regulator with XRE-family HTH domain